MRVALISIGCKVNQAENAMYESSLRGAGHEIVSLEEAPDYCIVNTCTVTSKSDYQSRQMIRRASRAGARVLVTGCYSELNKASVEAMQGVSDVISNANKDRIINMLDPLAETNALCSAIARTRYFLKIQDGCDHSCSYCIIYKARGRSRSVPIPDLVERTRRALALGHKEIVLTGVHIGLYGHDMGLELSDLIEELFNKTAVLRLRLSSLENTEIGPRLLELFHDARMSRHLHVPLQAGSDSVLRRMRRPYTTGEFRESIEAIIGAQPDIALGTDVIAGFPEESGGEFDETLGFVSSMPFTYMHVFPYSSRPGSEMAELGALEVAPEIKRQRAERLRKVSGHKRTAYMRRQLGLVLNPLIERIEDGFATGTTENYLKVRFLASGHSTGELVRVRVNGIANSELLAESEPEFMTHQ